MTHCFFVMEFKQDLHSDRWSSQNGTLADLPHYIICTGNAELVDGILR